MGCNQRTLKGVTMKNLAPMDCADLARDVYGIQSARDVSQFLARKEFSKDHKTVMKASVGCRILRAPKDAFRVCAVGGNSRSNEIFLGFRGTTKANKNADVWTDIRCGWEISTGGRRGAIGLNHAFTSMTPGLRAFSNEPPTVTGKGHCIGHSLGGAVATMASDWVPRNRPKTVRLCTFGAPRVGGNFSARS